MTSPPDPSVDADLVVRRVAEQGAQALAEVWVRVAVLEAQLAIRQEARPPAP